MANMIFAAAVITALVVGFLIGFSEGKSSGIEWAHRIIEREQGNETE